MNRREFIESLVAFALLPASRAGAASRAGRPNLLLITLDDMNWNSPACNGGALADATPHIDGLAAEGMRFERGHVNIAVCRPSRAVLMSGRYPHRNGTLSAQPLRAEVPLLTDALRDAGYRLGILGKVDHLLPVRRFGWTTQIDGKALGHGRDPRAYRAQTGAFLRAARSAEQPFFLMLNVHDPHRPFAGSADERAKFGEELATIPPPSRSYRPDEVPVPGFLPDLPDVRIELAQYYSSVRRCDDSVGAALEALESSGLAGETLVVLLSDNGMAFPFSKTNCYLNSTRVPWIVRWPGRVAPGRVDRDHFVSGIDLMPTLLEAAGLESPAGLDGRSFLPLLAGAAQAGRDRLVTVLHRDWAGRERPMRCIRLGALGYIYNAWSDGKQRFSNESGTGLTMTAMRRAAERDPALRERIDFFVHRQPEEFYDFAADPDALRDRSGDADFQPRLAEARRELASWMERTQDPLLPTFRAHLARLAAHSA